MNCFFPVLSIGKGSRLWFVGCSKIFHLWCRFRSVSPLDFTNHIYFFYYQYQFCYCVAFIKLCNIHEMNDTNPLVLSKMSQTDIWVVILGTFRYFNIPEQSGMFY